MMSFSSTLPLLFLALIWGASGAEWSINYNQKEMCALKGSTVFVNGTFTFPEQLTVKETFWAVDPVKAVEPNDLSKNPDYSGRVKYLTDKKKHFSLTLSNVMKKDEHQYCFRIISNKKKQKWVGTPGVTLRLTELHVESPGEVSEGESDVLTCNTTCNLTDPTFIWYKDGRPLTTKIIQKNQLHLQPVSSEDGGSYSCAVRGSEHLPSTDQTLRVRYPPKNISVCISPSGGIVEGSSVTLTCNSDGYPPVEIYTWFKGSSSVGTGESYSIPIISTEDSGEYTCQSRNQIGERRSTAVYLNILYPPKNVLVSISSSGKIVNLTCSSDANPPVENYTWFEEGGSSPVGSGQSYVSLQSGSYYCQVQNQHGAQRSASGSALIRGFPYVAVHTAVGVGCGLLFLVIIIFFFIIRSRNKRRSRSKEDFTLSTVYAGVVPRSAPSDAAEHSSEFQEVLYANVLQCRSIECRTAEERPGERSLSGAAVEEKLWEDEVQYASVKFCSPAPTNRYDEETADSTVVYSSIK